MESNKNARSSTLMSGYQSSECRLSNPMRGRTSASQERRSIPTDATRGSTIWMAEEEGFEPPCELPRKRFSRPPVSTTHPFLRTLSYPISVCATDVTLKSLPHRVALIQNRGKRFQVP